MGFDDAKLPWQTGMMDGAVRRCAGAAVTGGNQDDRSTCLGDAAGNGADSFFRDKLDGDPGVTAGVFQVIDQLGKILD